MPNNEFEPDLWRRWFTERMAEAAMTAQDVAEASDGELTSDDVELALRADEQPSAPTTVGVAKALGLDSAEALGAAGYSDLAATMSALSAGIPKAAPLPNFTVTLEQWREVEDSDDPPLAMAQLFRRRMVEEGYPLPGSTETDEDSASEE